MVEGVVGEDDESFGCIPNNDDDDGDDNDDDDDSDDDDDNHSSFRNNIGYQIESFGVKLPLSSLSLSSSSSIYFFGSINSCTIITVP